MKTELFSALSDDSREPSWSNDWAHLFDKWVSISGGIVARINFEDDVEAQDEFWVLLKLLGGNRDETIGKLVRFFRIAQKAYGYDEPMTEDDLTAKGFADMIKSGWAVLVEGGFHALGAEKHFKWYRQKVCAGIKGGRPKETYRLGTLSAANPLTLSPALAPSPAQKKEYTQEGLKNCIQEYQTTLDHYKIGRKAEMDEHRIASFGQRFGFEDLQLAIAGMRHEQKTENFDPANHVSVDRIPKNFAKFVNLGSRDKKKQTQEKVIQETKETSPEIQRTDPARVREILSKAGFKK